MPKRKSSDERPAIELVPQPHGGAIRRGNPGNSGGAGRPPAWYRQLARSEIDKHELVERLAKIASGEIGEIVESKDGREYCEAPLREQRGAIETLLKIGVGTSGMIAAEDVRKRIADTVDLLNEHLSDEAALPILEQMERIWR